MSLNYKTGLVSGLPTIQAWAVEAFLLGVLFICSNRWLLRYTKGID